jgi:uncharacterized SAM-binding protein YcdF (DUF218 family)
MFLFVSKIVALAFSPLVIVCALLAVVVFYARRPRLTRGLAAATLVFIVVMSDSWFSAFLVRTLESRNIPSGPLPHADAIVVLSSTAGPALPPQPVAWLDGATANRLIYAVELYREGHAPVVILSGGQLPWMKGLEPISESMARIIKTMGVPQSALIQESESGNTYENAVDVEAILRARKLHRILLVTSAMHMPRALSLFRHQGIDAIAAPCDFLSFKSSDQDASWQAIAISLMPDADNLTTTTMALKELLGIAFYRVAGLL